jgi:hypothetical protein
VDLDAQTVRTQLSDGSRVFRIFESSDQWVKGEDGDYRIAINRQTGIIVMLKVGASPFAFTGRCRVTQERLF